ncbi:hypothetical protein SPRG_14778 [Saprolegnia parasitica CBS 223.65]|uniref:Uncharacterized protein n=1 Tax=Saprolegnia parasitica (strain CBS 223.65) TaxID=695850 RepID=A0A067BSD0_SAPPC|nr:hypothetical protein SPRG_14778 [Saprolegnia parasitica CBS 223.65]KDO19700.1 hypothetical protein SPRG_14778 [Saprolegnia parasitica CBS 223.65]|eukprot:XP_012209615.1 hypothetical protein SPRG_14778 [Saprolegnia parasitica CBS 223.65]
MDQQRLSKRACVVPMAVVQSNVLVDIMHCLDSTKDVLSLLQALPPASLDAPLAALWTLLATPDALDAKHWPQVCVEEIDRRYTSTVLAALPLFRSIRIKNIERLNAMLLDVPIDEHWRPVLSTWLASGHATHLHLDNFTCDDDVEMGHNIAATTSLTSLKLNDSPGVVQGLVDANVPLPSITELRLQSAR